MDNIDPRRPILVGISAVQQKNKPVEDLFEPWQLTAEAILVTGGDAQYRTLLGRKAGIELIDTNQSDVKPDEVLAPEAELISQHELSRGLPDGRRHMAFTQDHALIGQMTCEEFCGKEVLVRANGTFELKG